MIITMEIGRFFRIFVTFIFYMVGTIVGVVIDNEIIGEPLIECRDTGIIFTINTRNPFRGNLYVRGQFGLPACRREFYMSPDPAATFAVPLNECGMNKMRQLQPAGLNFALTIVVSFHPQFVTKVDRSFNVHCFYAQTAQVLETDLKVDEIPSMPIQRDGVMFPKCQYSIREETVDGPIARSVNVGDPIVHRWNCDTSSNFGMLVKNCVVSDGGSSTDLVVDDRGCPTKTSVIQGPLSYDSSLSLAFVPVLAFSFPDRLLLNFKCQIEYCNKVEGECMGVSPPNCPMINPESYVPNSVINPNVDPTQIIGTYTSSSLGNGFNAPFPGGPPYPNPTNFPGQAFPLNDIPSTRPYAASRRHAIRFDENQSQRRLPYSKQDQIQPAHLKIFDKSSISSVQSNSPFKLFNNKQVIAALQSNATDRAGARTRRADAQTIDVIAEPVQIVQDLEENNMTRKTRRPHMLLDDASSTVASRRFCITRFGVATLIVILTVISGFCVALAAYVFHDLVIRRNKCRKSSITSHRAAGGGVFVTYAQAHDASSPTTGGTGARTFPFARLADARD